MPQNDIELMTQKIHDAHRRNTVLLSKNQNLEFQLIRTEEALEQAHKKEKIDAQTTKVKMVMTGIIAAVVIALAFSWSQPCRADQYTPATSAAYKQAEKEIAEFARTHPDFYDLMFIMADIQADAYNAGHPISFIDAYELAKAKSPNAKRF
jgi:hypothetical protein